jgi:4-amino-4-deoxy-L-arabinose transferase-like glycosyltransferase
VNISIEIREKYNVIKKLDFNKALLLICLLGFFIRLLYFFLVVSDNQLSGDAVSYHLTANIFADGLGFTEPFRYLFGAVDSIPVEGKMIEVVTPIGHIEPTAGHPPVWTLLLSVASFLGFTTVFEQQIFSILLGLPSIVLAGLVGRKISSERLGLIAASLTAAYTFIWINEGLLMAETCAITAAMACILAGLTFAENQNTRNALIFGSVGGLAALCRAELLIYLPFIAAVILLNKKLSWRVKILRYLSVGLAALLIISPWVIRNLYSFEENVFLSDGAGTVLVQANCDSTYYGQNLGYWELKCGEPPPYGEDGELLDESQRDIVVRERAFDYISEHKKRFITVVAPARIGRMWGAYKPIEQLRLDVLADRRSLTISLIGFGQYLLLLPLSLMAIFKLWKKRKETLFIASAWIPIVTFTAALTFGNTRYRTAAETSLVILAAFSIDMFMKKFSEKSKPM